jgi:hypothetical protein
MQDGPFLNPPGHSNLLSVRHFQWEQSSCEGQTEKGLELYDSISEHVIQYLELNICHMTFSF